MQLTYWYINTSQLHVVKEGLLFWFDVNNGSHINVEDEFLKRKCKIFRPHLGWKIPVLQKPSQKTGNDNFRVKHTDIGRRKKTTVNGVRRRPVLARLGCEEVLCKLKPSAPEAPSITGASYPALRMRRLQGNQDFWLENKLLIYNSTHSARAIVNTFFFTWRKLFSDCSEFCIPAVILSFKLLYYIICF